MIYQAVSEAVSECTATDSRISHSKYKRDSAFDEKIQIIDGTNDYLISTIHHFRRYMNRDNITYLDIIITNIFIVQIFSALSSVIGWFLVIAFCFFLIGIFSDQMFMNHLGLHTL